jgi:hypothetical protein
MLTARTTEYETRHLAGLAVNASIEDVDQAQLKLGNGAQAMTIPGIDLLAAGREAHRSAVKLNAPCTCGCDPPSPGAGGRSHLRRQPSLAQQIVKQIAGRCAAARATVCAAACCGTVRRSH